MFFEARNENVVAPASGCMREDLRVRPQGVGWEGPWELVGKALGLVAKVHLPPHSLPPVGG